MGDRMTTPTLRTMADRVELACRRALEDPELAQAADWYPAGRAWMESLAWDGVDLQGIAGAVAALSPQQSWQSQLTWTPIILDWFAKGGRIAAEVPGPGFHSNKDKALRCLLGYDPLEVLGGLKVRSFYLALLGDTESVVVDRHALDCAWDGVDHGSLTVKRYREIALAFTQAARELHIEPARAQALAWVWWKAHRAPSAGTKLG
jgi:hypothetical protein